MTTMEAHLVKGTPEVDAVRLVTDREDLTGYPALENDLHLWEEGRMVAWMVEMDTKYARSEPVMAPYAPPGKAIARFEMPDEYFDYMLEGEVCLPTDLEITLPAEGEWTMRVLFGRYDHLVVLQEKA